MTPLLPQVQVFCSSSIPEAGQWGGGVVRVRLWAPTDEIKEGHWQIEKGRDVGVRVCSRLTWPSEGTVGVKLTQIEPENRSGWDHAAAPSEVEDGLWDTPVALSLGGGAPFRDAASHLQSASTNIVQNITFSASVHHRVSLAEEEGGGAREGMCT